MDLTPQHNRDDIVDLKGRMTRLEEDVYQRLPDRLESLTKTVQKVVDWQNQQTLLVKIGWKVIEAVLVALVLATVGLIVL